MNSAWWPLVKHMEAAHDVVISIADCEKISTACDECRMRAGTPVAMILINALRSLSQEELVTLGKAIADRCGHGFERVGNASFHATGANETKKP